MDIFLLWLPLVALLLFVLYRIMYVYIVRRHILAHAKIIYEESLLYLGEHKYEILTLRQAFYEGIVSEQKVYKEYLTELEKMLKGRSKQLDKSIEYIMHVTL